MESIRQKHKASKFAPLDFVSRMPDNVVTSIMDRLPIQDAVRTSILSKNWRFKWTMLSQLWFDMTFFLYLLESKCENNYGKIISRLLLHLKGALTKFALCVVEGSELDDVDFNHWILFLSKKGIKDLTLWKIGGLPLKLPSHLFSCLELKHLKLFNCRFDPPASFHGFPNLLSLDFAMVQLKRSNVGEFITRSPLLQALKMDLLSLGKVKRVEIVKLANLKTLTLSLHNLDKKSSGSVSELVGFLPRLEELDLHFFKCMFTQGPAAKKRSPISYPHLKALKLAYIYLGDGIMLSSVLELIRCSPNLQTLEILEVEWDDDDDPPPAVAIPNPEVEYDTTGQSQLQSVLFRELKYSENGVCLIKYLLACSPFLKKIVIHPHSSLASGENLFTRKLLKLQRAYPLVDIDYY